MRNQEPPLTLNSPPEILSLPLPGSTGPQIQRWALPCPTESVPSQTSSVSPNCSRRLSQTVPRPQQPSPPRAASPWGPQGISFPDPSDTLLWVCSQMAGNCLQQWGLKLLCLCFKISYSVSQWYLTLCNPMDAAQLKDRLPCPSLSPPEVCWNSCPLSRRCHPITSSSVDLFSSCPQSFPASVFFSELALKKSFIQISPLSMYVLILYKNMTVNITVGWGVIWCFWHSVSNQALHNLASITTFPASSVLESFALDSLPSPQEACMQPPSAPH